MINIYTIVQLLSASIITLAIIWMQIVKKNTTLVNAYIFQSAGLIILLGMEVFRQFALGLFIVTLFMFFIKIIIAPTLFYRIIKKNHENLSATTYLNVPMTLIVLLAILSFAQSNILSPIFPLLSMYSPLRITLMGSVLMSMFLIINRKGALSQIIGVLSLENAVFTFGIFLGVKQLAALEIGILFDVFFWIVISSIFANMIYQNFGSFDISKLNQLKK